MAKRNRISRGPYWPRGVVAFSIDVGLLYSLSSERFPESQHAVQSAALTAYGPTLGFGTTF